MTTQYHRLAPSGKCAIPAPRVVLHVDLDAFFVQVERSLNPTLVGKPMVVQQHADIIAVSYEARKMGVTKHMPTTTIRQKYPSVRLVHAETIGVQNKKVSYRNYRRAARSIFTLIRAFCAVEDGGMFQKASVDEAYLQPSRDMLEAELSRSQRCAGLVIEEIEAIEEKGPTVDHKWIDAQTLSTMSGRRTHRATTLTPEDESDGRRQVLSGAESATSGSQGGAEGDERTWDVAVGESPPDTRRPGGMVDKAKVKEYDELEGRLLHAGGLLGKRMQQTLKDVLEYDCSIGVASNKFLAKLATNLAKPKGVKVLRRRDIPPILASTPATKIPGCGTESVAAAHFAKWGVTHVLDLRRFEAGQLRDRLGEQLGAKVYDRCRGIDNEEVVPDPLPSRVSTSVSLVPLIRPAHCLGQPGEKLTPVHPWEVERLTPFLVTLAQDLIDRMKEEVNERGRRPNKLCVEHYLHHRGAKSMKFSLPQQLREHGRSGASNGREPQTVDDAEKFASECPDIPLAACLVELALTPFKNYRDSRTMGGSFEARGGKRQGSLDLPPVVKIILSFSAFETIDSAAPVAAAPGQQTLSMIWPDRRRDDIDAPEDAAGSGTSGRERRHHDPLSAGGRRHNDPPTAIEDRATTNGAVAGENGLARSPVAPISDASPFTREEARNTPTTVEGSLLVRCPLCKACLPLGTSWDRHREEHSTTPPARTRQSLATRHVPPGGSPVESGDSTGIQLQDTQALQRSRQPEREADGSRRHVTCVRRYDGQAKVNPAGCSRGIRRYIPEGEQELLSDLLRVAITASEAANVLRERGFLREDGSTRFAHIDDGTLQRDAPSTE